MKTTSSRRIRRGTILFPRVYGSEETLPPAMMEEVREIAAKGYHAVEIFPLAGEEAFVRQFCAAARPLGLEIWVLTNYMKYQEGWLAQHPEQKVVLARDARDSDGLSTSNWGCPYNPGFKARGIGFLQEVARQPGVTRIGLNDEAMLLSGCYCQVCRAAWDEEVGGPMPVKAEAVAEDWREESWRRYLQWKLQRWNDVHAELARAVRDINPAIKVLFQTSPACDLWLNPWETGVDLSSMVEQLDGLSTDPYYTFHGQPFHPAETYLSEWSRFLRGITPGGKEAEIVVQAFSHPTFSRPLGREDGYWSALIPPACGIDIVTPYTYSFQKCSPVQPAYEECFQWDSYFEETSPLRYAAIVHSSQSEIYAHPLPNDVPNSYDWTRVLPTGEALRHSGLPYDYLSDRRVAAELDDLNYKVLLLPEVSCLSPAQEEAWKRYIEAGGNLIVLGGFGTAWEQGERRPHSLLHELFDVEVLAEECGHREFFVESDHRATRDNTITDDGRARREMNGTLHPAFTLRHTLRARAGQGCEVLATFTGEERDPAIVRLPAPGRVLWFAGFPSRTCTHSRYGTVVLNRAHSLLAHGAAWAAGQAPALRVEEWPPLVPMARLRPFDGRNMSTYEFFPLEGERSFLALIVSYFKEPSSFPLKLDVPAGRTLKTVTELVEGRSCVFETEGSTATVVVSFGYETCAQLYRFELD